MNQSFQVRGGKILGRDHARSSQNRQDGYALKHITIGERAYVIGAVSDGCGSGTNSEVAGLLSPIFVVNQVAHLLQFEIPVSQIPVALYPYVVGFLDSIRKLIPFGQPHEIVSFIQDYLLATVIGFVIGEEEGVVFHAGDGFLVVNEATIRIEHGNQSPYVGYQLVPRSMLMDEALELPRTFAARQIETASLERLAVATDGFTAELLARLWGESFPGLLGVQLWMNKINGPRNPAPDKGLFYDDGAIVVLERLERGG